MPRRDDSVWGAYAFALFISAVVFAVVGFAGGWGAFATVLILSTLEVTFSFDNAVVNAKVLQKMSVFWRQMFMTVGIIIALFGMRLLLPILLVALTAGLSMGDVVRLAIERPGDYARYIDQAHPVIASFGGIFLLMIFLEFLLDRSRRVHWLRAIEQPVMKIGRFRQISPLISLAILITVVQFLGGTHKLAVLTAGALGITVYLAIRSIAGVFELKQEEELGHAVGRRASAAAGLVAFLYLELLDASFSFDGVIGAFAITNRVFLIAAGLGIGAIWVRSMTIDMVRRQALAKYRYLDHGAHYAIGALAAMLLLGIRYEIPEVLTGSAGILIIVLAFMDSWRYNLTHKLEPQRQRN